MISIDLQKFFGNSNVGATAMGYFPYVIYLKIRGNSTIELRRERKMKRHFALRNEASEHQKCNKKRHHLLAKNTPTVEIYIYLSLKLQAHTAFVILQSKSKKSFIQESFTVYSQYSEKIYNRSRVKELKILGKRFLFEGPIF